MNKLFIAVAMVFLSQKTLTCLQKTQYCKTAEFNGDNLVYDFATPHSNNREHVVTELETYRYTRKGGVGG